MKSPIHGLGLFADETIKKDTKVYSINKDLDLIISVEKFDKLSKNEQQTFRHYGYFDNKENVWNLSFDDIRFCNHSFDSNVTLRNNYLVSIREIKKGEEITQNYGEFELLRNDLQLD